MQRMVLPLCERVPRVREAAGFPDFCRSVHCYLPRTPASPGNLCLPDLRSGKIGTLTLILHIEDFQMITWHEELTFDFFRPRFQRGHLQKTAFLILRQPAFAGAHGSLPDRLRHKARQSFVHRPVLFPRTPPIRKMSFPPFWIFCPAMIPF